MGHGRPAVRAGRVCLPPPGRRGHDLSPGPDARGARHRQGRRRHHDPARRRHAHQCPPAADSASRHDAATPGHVRRRDPATSDHHSPGAAAIPADARTAAPAGRSRATGPGNRSADTGGHTQRGTGRCRSRTDACRSADTRRSARGVADRNCDAPVEPRDSPHATPAGGNFAARDRPSCCSVAHRAGSPERAPENRVRSAPCAHCLRN